MDFLEIDVVHKRGPMTYWHTFVSYGWWLCLCGFFFLYAAYAMYLGPWVTWMHDFLADFPDYFITNDMVSLWSLLTGISFVFVAYLRANVMYRQYKFTLDEHAFRLRKGLFRIREYTFPYNQIANVHIDQPYHWRLLGLASVDIVSASDSYDTNVKKGKGDYLIPMMDKKRAKTLRAQILRYGSGEGSPYEDMYGPDEDEYDDYEEDEFEEYEDEDAYDDEPDTHVTGTKNASQV